MTEPSVRRAKQRPTVGTTFHLIGDTHVGATGIAPWRMDALIGDVMSKRSDVPDVAAYIQLGDNTNTGTASEMDEFSRILLDRYPSQRRYLAQGNHDLFNQNTAQWAARWGYPAANYTADVDGIRLVVMGGDNGVNPTWSRMPPATLLWLDVQLAAAGTRPVFIACHFPIWDTVGADIPLVLEYTSRQDGFFVNTTAHPGNSDDIIGLLAAYPNVKAWLSGHTHSSLDVPGLVMPFLAGSNRIAHVNASCLWYCGKHPSPMPGRGATDPVHSSYATWTGDRLTVRYRHHVTGQWYGPNGNRELTVDNL